MNKQVFRQNIVAGVAVMAVGIAAFVLTFGMPGHAPLFPRVASTLLCLLGCVLCVTNLIDLKADAATGKKPVLWGSLVYPAHTIAIALAYVLAIPNLGFYLSTALMLVVYMYYMGARSVGTIAVVTLAVSVIVYLVFSVQLGVPLPRGLLL